MSEKILSAMRCDICDNHIFHPPYYVVDGLKMHERCMSRHVRGMDAPEDARCRCGKSADFRYHNEDLCDACLNETMENYVMRYMPWNKEVRNG